MESRVPQHIPGVPASIMVQPLLDSRVPYGRLQPHHHHHHHPRTIYPIDQMRSTHVENDYIDSPAAVVSQQPQQAKHPVAPSRPIEPNHHHHHHHPHHHHTQHSHTQDSTHPWINFSGRPSSISSSSSTSSDQRLLDHAAPTPMVDSVPFSATTASSSSLPLGTPPSLVRIAGTALSNSPPQSKLLGCSKSVDSKTVGAPEESVLGGVNAKHLLVCEHCGKCRCTECTMPRALPSCWVCRQSCLCSAQSLVDAATCMCLVRGVFYHCAEDDGDDGDEGGSCADRPCSCGPAHRCARWSFMTALSVALPCLLCYLPAIGCAKLSQRCYDAAQRPGCRCKVPTTASATTAAAKTKAKAGVAGILGKAAGSLDKQAS